MLSVYQFRFTTTDFHVRASTHLIRQQFLSTASSNKFTPKHYGLLLPTPPGSRWFGMLDTPFSFNKPAFFVNMLEHA